MPKPAADALLSCKVVPTVNRDEEELDGSRQAVANGHVCWSVNILETSERFTVPAGSDDSTPDPDPYIEADFTVLQHDGQLTVVKWSISGTELISTRKSRIPLQSYARAALIAIEDLLAANGERSYEQMIAERRGHVSFLEMSNGRVIDPHTREQRKQSRRTHTAATNGNRPGLELADVADTYRKAVKRGSRSPTVDVANHFHVGRSSAARALAEARKQGLLGPALRTRAGEQT